MGELGYRPLSGLHQSLYDAEIGIVLLGSQWSVNIPAGVALAGFNIRGCGWPLKQPEMENRGSKYSLWGSLCAQEFSKVQKEGGHEGLPKAARNPKLGGHFCRMCTYDPMSLSSAIPASQGKHLECFEAMWVTKSGWHSTLKTIWFFFYNIEGWIISDNLQFVVLMKRFGLQSEVVKFTLYYDTFSHKMRDELQNFISKL